MKDVKDTLKSCAALRCANQQCTLAFLVLPKNCDKFQTQDVQILNGTVAKSATTAHHKLLAVGCADAHTLCVCVCMWVYVYVCLCASSDSTMYND
jgi:hypothetical protein